MRGSSSSIRPAVIALSLLVFSWCTLAAQSQTEPGSVVLERALRLNVEGNPDAAFALLKRFALEGIDELAVIDAMGLAVLRLPLMPADVPPAKRDMIRLAGRGGYHMARVRRSAIGRLAFEELASRYPREANVHYAFGTYLIPEEPDAAIAEFRKELALAPEHYPSMLQIAFVETKRGHAQEALPLAEQAVRIAPDAPASRLVLGRALLELGQTARAIEELERGAALSPDNPGFPFSLARAYQQAGRPADAARARAAFRRLNAP